MGFNASSEPPKGGFPVIPMAVYTVAMVAFELKDSGSTPGNQYMNCQFKVTKGKHKGAVIYKMFHCFPAVTSDFADQEVAAVEHLMYLMGVKKLKGAGKDWTPLLNKEVNAKVTIEKDEDGKYDDKNVISSRGFTEKSKVKKSGSKGKSGTGVKDPQDAPWDKKKRKEDKGKSKTDKPGKKKKKKKKK